MSFQEEISHGNLFGLEREHHYVLKNAELELKMLALEEVGQKYHAWDTPVSAHFPHTNLSLLELKEALHEYQHHIPKATEEELHQLKAHVENMYSSQGKGFKGVLNRLRSLASSDYESHRKEMDHSYKTIMHMISQRTQSKVEEAMGRRSLG